MTKCILCIFFILQRHSVIFIVSNTSKPFAVIKGCLTPIFKTKNDRLLLFYFIYSPLRQELSVITPETPGHTNINYSIARGLWVQSPSDANCRKSLRTAGDAVKSLHQSACAAHAPAEVVRIQFPVVSSWAQTQQTHTNIMFAPV